MGLVFGGEILIILTALLFYRPLWVGMVQVDGMPWGSDTLGHLLRFGHIRRNIQADDSLPHNHAGMVYGHATAALLRSLALLFSISS